MSEKIKECPLCGGGGEVIRWQRGGAAFAFVKCVGACRLAGHEVVVVGGEMDEAISKAVASWNYRPREERLVKLLREARHGIDRLHEGDCGGPAVEPCRWCRLRAAIDAELGERPWTNKRIAEFMDAISEHSVLVAPAPDGTILVTDAGETLIATSEGWKPWDPEHDIRCWHGPEGLLATIEERGKREAFTIALWGSVGAGYMEWAHIENVAWWCLCATPPQLAAALVKVIEEAHDA